MLQWDVGKETHKPTQLPDNKAAIYIFKYHDLYLKVGKVNAKSNARYQSQHYNPNSSNSNLSKSLLNDAKFQTEFQVEFSECNVGVWIKENTTRFNILIPTSYGDKLVHFAEAFFILKYNPRLENTRT